MEQWGLPDLPHEVVYDILSRLPVKPLCRFKSVSKPWLALITDPHFIKSHLHQSMKNNTNQKLIVAPQFYGSKYFYSLDYQAPNPTVAELEMPGKSAGVEIWGSFNGVLLVDIDEELCLWNPSIRMYQRISRPRCTRSWITYALGYDSINDDFKVVGAVPATMDGFSRPAFASDGPSTVHVFSSKLSSWKCIGDFDYPCHLYYGTSRSVLNGSPHWITHCFTDIDGYYFRIVCFDVMEEKFKDVPTPMYEVGFNFFEVGVLDGCLCAVDRRSESHFDVWVMKEYGVKESWTKLFVVPNVPLNVAGELFFRYFDLLCFTKDGEAVLRFQLEASVKLAIYNPKQKTYKRIVMPQDLKGFDVSLYVESLVSPHGCKRTVLEDTANQMEMEENFVIQIIPISCFSLFTHFAYVICNWCVNTLLLVLARSPSG